MASKTASAIRAAEHVSTMQERARAIANQFNIPLPPVFENYLSVTMRLEDAEQVVLYQALVAELFSAQMELFAAALEKVAANQQTPRK